MDRFLLVIFGFSLIAGPVFGGNIPVALTAEKPWRTVEGGGYSVPIPANEWSGFLIGKARMQAGTVYRLDWESRISGKAATPDMLLFYRDPGERRELHSGNGSWNSQSSYYFADRTGELEFRFYFNPGPAGEAAIRNLTIQEVRPEQLSENLLPDGDWESGNTMPGNWRPMTGGGKAEIVTVTDFFAGSKALMLTPSPQQRANLFSLYMPMMPGGTATMTFWAKGSGDLPLSAAIDGISPRTHHGKHFYKTETFKVTADWKEFTLTTAIPDDFDAWPDLKERLAKLRFTLPPDGEGCVWIDNVSFTCN